MNRACVFLICLMTLSSARAAFGPLEWNEGMYLNRPSGGEVVEPDPSEREHQENMNEECEEPTYDPRWAKPRMFSPESFGWGYFLPSEIEEWMNGLHNYLVDNQGVYSSEVFLERVTFGHSRQGRPLVAYCLGGLCKAWLDIHRCQICNRLAQVFLTSENTDKSPEKSPEEICSSGEVGGHQIDHDECLRIAGEMLELKPSRLSGAPVTYDSICSACADVPHDHSMFEIDNHVQRSGIYTALTHPREASTLSTLLRFVWELVTANEGNPISNDVRDLCGENEERFNCFKNILMGTLTWIVPLVNPDTYVYNWESLKSSRYAKFGLGRKTRDPRYCSTEKYGPKYADRIGVDINRNFPTFDYKGKKGMVHVHFKNREIFKIWGTAKTKILITDWIKKNRKNPWNFTVKYEGRNPKLPECADSFSGVEAASEPETAGLVKLFEATRPNFAVHVHSAVPGVIAPDLEDLNESDAEVYRQLVNSKKDGQLQTGVDDMYKWGSPPKVVGYPGDGDVVTYHTYNTRTWSFGPEVGERRQGWTPNIETLEEYGLGILPLMVNCAAVTGKVPPPTTNMTPDELHTFGLEKFGEFVAERGTRTKAHPRRSSSDHSSSNSNVGMMELNEVTRGGGKSLREAGDIVGDSIELGRQISDPEGIVGECSPSDLYSIIDLYGFAISRLPECAEFSALERSCMDERFEPDINVSKYASLCLACTAMYGDKQVSELGALTSGMVSDSELGPFP